MIRRCTGDPSQSLTAVAASMPSGLQVGDCGVVREIAEDGHVTVSWDRGFAVEIDPDVNQYRRLAA